MTLTYIIVWQHYRVSQHTSIEAVRFTTHE